MYRPVFEVDCGIPADAFDTAIDYIDRNEVAFKLSDEKVDKIREDVEHIINYLAEEIGSTNSRFMPQVILKVGSFFEGTKIFEPDEFDFLVVIEELSTPGILKVKPIGSTGFANVTLQDSTAKETWKDFLKGDRLLNLMEYDESPVQKQPTSYSDVLLFVLRRMAMEQSLKFKDMYGDFFCDAGITVGKKGECKAKIKKVFVRCPNIEMKLDYDGFEIGVDMSPAIRYHNIGDVMLPAQCLHPSLYSEIEKRGGCLLVNGWYNQQSDAFRLTFTDSEVSLVQNMTTQHKKVYKFFKLMHALTMELVITASCADISSYLMKTACLLHDLDSGRQEHPTEDCIGRIINYLFVSVNVQHMPNLFNKDQDLLRFDTYEKKKRIKQTVGELNIFAYIYQQLYIRRCETPTVRGILRNLVFTATGRENETPNPPEYDSQCQDNRIHEEVIYDRCKIVRGKSGKLKKR